MLNKHPVAWAASTREDHKMHSPSGSVPLWSFWEPEQLKAGKCTKHSVHLGQCPCKACWSLSSVDLGSTCCLGLWQTQCGASTVSSLHTCQQSLFAVPLPPYSTAEQVSLNEWPCLPPCVRGEVRHLQTEEAKISKEGGTTLEMTDATD